MKTKDYKEAYANYVKELVEQLGLEQIDTVAIEQVFGKGKKAPETKQNEAEDVEKEGKDDADVKEDEEEVSVD